MSLEARVKISESLNETLAKQDPEARAAKVAKKKAHAALDLPDCHCFAHMRNSPTDIEILLVNTLLVEFPEVRTQEQFGCYHVDAYLPPPYHLAFEADGAYWHQNPKKDAARDRWLLRKFGLPTVRLSGQELKEVCRGAC